MTKRTKGLLVVLSSPSGGGKTTICEKILGRHKDYVRSVSVTTRKRRKGEKQGQDYLFVTEEEFKKKIRRREFVEWAWVHGHRYGTLRRSATQAQEGGKVAFFVLDVQGGMAMKKQYPDSVLIFILPPSLSELKRRLIRRGTESSQEVKDRLQTALKEMDFRSKYDYVVINRNLGQTVKSVEEIIRVEKLRSSRFDHARWSKDNGQTETLEC
jgi:guanylate kinase